MIKCELSSKNWDFVECESTTISLIASQSLKTFSDEIESDINECYFLILYNEMHQQLKGLCNSDYQYYPNKCMMLQNHAWAKKIHSNYKLDQRISM